MPEHDVNQVEIEKNKPSLKAFRIKDGAKIIIKTISVFPNIEPEAMLELAGNHLERFKWDTRYD